MHACIFHSTSADRYRRPDRAKGVGVHAFSLNGAEPQPVLLKPAGKKNPGRTYAGAAAAAADGGVGVGGGGGAADGGAADGAADIPLNR